MASNISRMPCPENPQSLVGKILPPVLILEMIVGLPGTLLALWIFCFRLKDWKSNTLFLFNLVLADFFLLVSVPFRIHNTLLGEYWVFGQALCRFNLFSLAVNRSASIVFMTTVAVDRYLKLVHPHHRISSITKTLAPRLALLIWAVVLALHVPLLAVPLLHKRGNLSLCRSFGSYFHEPPVIQLHNVVFFLEFFLPLPMLIFCTVGIGCVLRRRQLGRTQRARQVVRQAVRAVSAIVVVFVVCFSPGIIVGLVGFYFHSLELDCDKEGVVSQLFRLSIGFTYLNSALDPIIYSLSSSMYRNALTDLFYSLVPGGGFRTGRNRTNSVCASTMSVFVKH